MSADTESSLQGCSDPSSRFRVCKHTQPHRNNSKQDASRCRVRFILKLNLQGSSDGCGKASSTNPVHIQFYMECFKLDKGRLRRLRPCLLTRVYFET